MVNVGIVGATGYAGEELIEILLRHPQVRITSLQAIIDRPREISEIFPQFKNRISLVCQKPDTKALRAKCDFIFLALPHTASMEVAPELLSAHKMIIDLSADYRLKDTKIYKDFYHSEHKDKTHIKDAVYGLPELYRQKIKVAKFIANPGCYPTAAILGLAPLVAVGCVDLDSIIIDAKSGITGAGRKQVEDFLSSEASEDFKAYKVGVHQHMPEINQELSKLAGKAVEVVFVPHLLPVKRGILETIYVKQTSGSKLQASGLIALYKKFYKTEPFVRIKEEGDFPQLKDVVGTNYCDIGLSLSAKQIIIITAIDNLLKGASGQAVQNMNIMYKFPEATALL